MTTYPHPHARRPHVNPWLVAGVLAAALVGLGAWVLIDRNTSATVSSAGQPHGLASASVAAMLGERIAAANRGDGKAVAAFYSRAGVLEERDVTPAVVTRGNEQIGARLQELFRTYGIPLKPESSVIQFGRYVAEALSWEVGGGIVVYQLDANGKIAHQWAIGGSLSP